MRTFSRNYAVSNPRSGSAITELTEDVAQAGLDFVATIAAANPSLQLTPLYWRWDEETGRWLIRLKGCEHTKTYEIIRKKLSDTWPDVGLQMEDFTFNP